MRGIEQATTEATAGDLSADAVRRFERAIDNQNEHYE